MAILLKTVLCAVFFYSFVFSEAYAESKDFAQILKQVDDIKSSDYNKSVNLLKLISDTEALTAEQRSYYYYLKGYQLAYVGDYATAVQHYEKSLSLSNDILLNYRTKISLANLYGIKRNASLALEYLIPALEESESILDKEHKHNGILVASIVYSQFGLYPQADEVTSNLLNDTPNHRVRCFSLAIWHEAQFHQNKSIDPQKILDDSSRCKKDNQVLPSVVISSFSVYQSLRAKNYRQAETELATLMPEVESTNYTRYISEYVYLHAAALFGLADYKNAEVQLKKSLDMNSNAGNTRPVIDSLLLLSKVKEHDKNYLEALEYYKRYAEAEKYYNDDISSQKLAYQLAKGQLFSKNQQIELLEKNNSLLKLESELASTEATNNKLLISLLLVVLGSVVYFTIKTVQSRTKYRSLAENDNLTGISNRYHFTDKVKDILQLSCKTNRIDSFIIFDLDFFKQINDQYGHLTGDWVLQTVVEHSRQFVRNVDIFGRIGGEEFAVYLPACTPEKAALLAEILRDAIAQVDYTKSGHPIHMTASFGVTSTEYSGYELKHLFRDADFALYQSKNAGRNQVTLFEKQS